jgi:hypothetical protein
MPDEANVAAATSFGHLQAFVYHCFDRIVIHGYLRIRSASARLDLRVANDHATFEALLTAADVLLRGNRPWRFHAEGVSRPRILRTTRRLLRPPRAVQALVRTARQQPLSPPAKSLPARAVVHFFQVGGASVITKEILSERTNTTQREGSPSLDSWANSTY